MVKKLLNQFFKFFSFSDYRNKIENYLSQSSDLTDLENRIKELEKNGTYSKFYI